MDSNPTFDSGLLRLAGIAGILVGLCILTFAIVGESFGIFFFDDVASGASIEPWIRNVQASPELSKFLMVLPILGFSCLLIVGIVLYRYIAESSWQKNLSLAGYAVGVPIAVGTFIAQLALMNEVLLLYGKTAAQGAYLETVGSLQLYSFYVINHFIGPFFVVVLGTTLLAWAALKSGRLPRWICYWLMTCGALLFVSFFSPVVPALGAAEMGAPLHMLGVLMLGLILLRRSQKREV
jgi:hypothetical protein